MIDSLLFTFEEIMSQEVRENEMRSSVIVDFDGTLCPFGYPHWPAPYRQSRTMLQRLKSAGFRILIHSARTSSIFKDGAEHLKGIKEYMEEHSLPYDEIVAVDKPIGIAYIDDHAYRATGDNLEEIADAIISGGVLRQLESFPALVEHRESGENR